MVVGPKVMYECITLVVYDMCLLCKDLGGSLIVGWSKSLYAKTW